jgi:ferredoxin
MARCTTCRVQVISGDLPEMGGMEQARLARDESFGPDIRLSCQVRVESDMTIRVLARGSETGQPIGTRPTD